MNLLVLNCGSATVKYKLFAEAGDELSELEADTVEVASGYEAAVAEILATLPRLPDAVAHRVVHGGDKYFEPALINEEVLAQIEAMADFAPLHNPPALSGIRATEHLGKPQVAAFDTAFHQTMPPRAYQYALPRELTERLQLRRYGFHGQSHRYVSHECGRILGTDMPTLISLHLGNGASCAAIRQGRCVDTSMGATPLEGLVMGSRGGDLDPATSILLQRKGMKLDEVEALFWHEAGLKGMAQENDMRRLLAREDEAAQQAIDLFCYRARKYVGAYLAALGGAQAIVFTGGIGENAPMIRSRILSGLESLGIELDEARNEANEGRVSTDSSRIALLVIPTNEELMIATDALRVLRELDRERERERR
jgi:acetate kinase